MNDAERTMIRIGRATIGFGRPAYVIAEAASITMVT